MKIALFSTHHFERQFFDRANAHARQHLSYFETQLNEQTADLCDGFEVACAFVSDRLDAKTLEKLKACGVKLVALRSVGFNHVDLAAASRLQIPVVRVPEYSPYAVAEHAVGLILTLNRKIHRAYNRVREFNFSLDGLVGFDLHGKTVGVIGTGRIGAVFARIMKGFGCRILAFDPKPNPALAAELGLTYVTLDALYGQSDIISLHVPLTPETHHLIDASVLQRFKSGAMLINTGRGALIDSHALIAALKSEKLGAAGLDVYEEEEGIFFKDLSDKVLQDDTLARLLTFPNVLVTSHQAFLTVEALSNIAATTLQNIAEFERGAALSFEVRADRHLAQAP